MNHLKYQHICATVHFCTILLSIIDCMWMWPVYIYIFHSPLGRRRCPSKIAIYIYIIITIHLLSLPSVMICACIEYSLHMLLWRDNTILSFTVGRSPPRCRMGTPPTPQSMFSNGITPMWVHSPKTSPRCTMIWLLLGTSYVMVPRTAVGTALPPTYLDIGNKIDVQICVTLLRGCLTWIGYWYFQPLTKMVFILANRHIVLAQSWHKVNGTGF